MAESGAFELEELLRQVVTDPGGRIDPHAPQRPLSVQRKFVYRVKISRLSANQQRLV